MVASILYGWLLQNVVAEELLFSEDVGSSLEDVVASPDGAWVVFATGSTGQIHILSTASWEIQTADVCSGSIGGLIFSTAGDLFVGCGAKGILVINPATADIEHEIALSVDQFYFASAYQNKGYFLAKNPNGSNPQVQQVDLQAMTVLTDTYPITLGYGAAKDMETVGNYLIVSHGSTSISKVEPNSGGTTRDLNGPTAGTCTDILPDATSSNALVAAGTSGVYRFLFASNRLQIASASGTVQNATALATVGNELWVADANANSLKMFSYTSNGAIMGSELLAEVPLDWENTVYEMLFVDEYLFLATSQGMVGVVGNGPWVEAIGPNPGTLEEEGAYTIAFSSTKSGEYSVRLGGDSDTTGTEIATGSITADEEVQIDLAFTQDDGYIEGKNSLRVVVDSVDGIGHDTVYLVVDRVPTTPTLTASNVGFGSGEIHLSLTGIVDADLDHYVVYVSKQEFSGDDYDTGGPSLRFLSETDRTMEIAPEETVQISLSGFTNDVLYYVAVRAYDATGKESAMSNVLSVTPRETLSASALSGETGGYCGFQTPAGISTIGVVMMLIAFRRKNLISSMVVGSVVMLSMLHPQTAQASSQFSNSVEDAKSIVVEEEEKLPAIRASSAVHYGPVTFQSEVLNTVFTDSNHQILYLERGYAAWDIVGVSVGAGLVREKGYLVSADGSSSSQGDTLSVIPVSASVFARGDFFNEQILVPFATAGVDYWIWQEKWTVDDAKTSTNGGKQGYHYSYGGEVLLDVFDPVAASLLDVTRGIRDTYFTVEYRVQEFQGDGLSFNSDSVTFGFRFQY